MHSDPYMHPGVYVCASDTVAKTLVNCPLNKAFLLQISNILGPRSDYRLQTYYSFDGERVARCLYDAYSSTWRRTYIYLGEQT